MQIRVFATHFAFETDDLTFHFLKKSLKKQGIKIEKKIPVDCIWLDAGGPMNRNEAEVYFEANGVKFGTFARHLPHFLSAFSRAKELEDCPGYLRVGGMMYASIFSTETRDAAIPAMEKLIADNAAVIDESQRKLDRALSEIPNVLHQPECCFCGSEKAYKDCCGKGTRAN